MYEVEGIEVAKVYERVREEKALRYNGRSAKFAQ